MAPVSESHDLARVLRTAQGFAIDCRFPRPDRYLLQIFARTGSSDGTYDLAAEYLVCAGSDGPARGAGTQPSAEHGYRDIKALLPRHPRVPRGRIEFAILAPGAVEVAVVQGDRRYRLAAKGVLFHGKVTLRQGRCEVVGRFPDRLDDERMQEYEVVQGRLATMTRALAVFVLWLFPTALSG